MTSDVGATVCSDPGCDSPVHARGMCPAHYNRWRRAHPDAPVRARVSPTATLAERVAAHVEAVDGHEVWRGFLNRGMPGLVTDGHVPGRRRVHNVREVVLTAAGFPRPPVGSWTAVSTCGVPECVAAGHLTWTNRRADATLTAEVVDGLIARHARGDCNVADEADRLGVARQTIYKAMRRRGYVVVQR